MITREQLIELLKEVHADPMWSHHVELSKQTLRLVIDELERRPQHPLTDSFGG